MQVGDDGGGAVGHHRPRVLVDPEHRALDVGVAVDERRQQVGALEVDPLAGLIAAAQSGYPALEDDDIGIFDLTREGVDDAGVGEEQVAGGVAAGDRYEVLQAHGSSSSR